MGVSNEQILVRRLAILRARIAVGDRGTLATNYGSYGGERRELLNLQKALIEDQDI